MVAYPEVQSVPILMYHSISDQASSQFRSFTVAPALFAEQMAYLQREAYTPLSVSQFITQRARGVQALPDRPVILTFDDGFADFYTHAFPVLTSYDFPATLYVTTGYVSETSRWLHHEGEATRAMLTWEQLREISAHSVECGAHTHTHPQLDLLSPIEARAEIVQSKSLLEHHLGVTIKSFAYPYGYYTAQIKRIVQETGYDSACAVKFTLSSSCDDAYTLARLKVSNTTDMQAFASLLQAQSVSRLRTFYTTARTSVWRVVRQCSFSVSLALSSQKE